MNNLINIIQLMQNMIFAAFSYQGMKNPLPHGITFMRLLSAKKEKATKKTTDISKMTVAELRELAKAKGIEGFTAMKKAELLEVLK